MLVWQQILQVRLQGDSLQAAVSGDEPAVYRFLIRIPGQKAGAYVGETVELRRRVYQYMNPGPSQQTNIWLSAQFRGALSKNGTVVMEVMDLASVPPIGNLGLPNLQMKYWRRLLEAAGCLEAQGEGFEILNR